MDSLTKTLAEFTAGTDFSNLPGEVVHESKRLILDTIGCCFGGIRSTIGSVTLDLVRDLGGYPQATVIGSGHKTSTANAAYANSRIANAIDADECFCTGGHFGAPVVGAALAICENRHASGEELITAVSVGFEVGARVILALGAPAPAAGYSRSFSPAVPNVFATAAAAARASRLEAAKVGHAFGIAGANAPVSSARKWASQMLSPMTKYFDSGWGTQTGVTAALLAEKGTTGLDTILDGDSGLLAFFGCSEQGFDTRGLGQRWYMPETEYKPWPTCRVMHSGLTCLLRILNENGLAPEEIDRVVLRVPPYHASPRFQNQEPVGEVTRQFSHPHAMAMAALGIKRGPLWIAASVADNPTVREFRKKVFVEADPGSSRLKDSSKEQRMHPAVVEVTARGRTFTAATCYAKGSPCTDETRFTDEELKEKFRDMASALAGNFADWQEQVEAIITMTSHLEDLNDVGELTRMLSPGTPISPLEKAGLRGI